MNRKSQGRYEEISTVGEKVKAFIPASLPPSPPIFWPPLLRSKFDEALISIGRLDSASNLLPDMDFFREIHCRLLSKGRGADKTPGEFWRVQNWIGGTRPGNAVFIPPPTGRVLMNPYPRTTDHLPPPFRG